MKLALGTVQFGLDYGINNSIGRLTANEANAVLRRAQESGMDTLDTAIAYGESEAVLGSLGVQSWKVVTKLPAVPADCCNVEQWVNEQALGSLKRLGITRLHGMLLHRPAQLLENRGPSLHAALKALRKQGLVNKIGISVYNTAELDYLFEKYTFDIVQAPLNILDRSLMDSGWAKKLKNAGVEIHTRSAFLQGLLLMPASARPTKFEHWANILTEWDHWLSESKLSALQACLRYFNALDCIDRVVIGVDSVAQLEEIILSTEGGLKSLPEFKPIQDNRLLNPASWNQL